MMYELCNSCHLLTRTILTNNFVTHRDNLVQSCACDTMMSLCWFKNSYLYSTQKLNIYLIDSVCLLIDLDSYIVHDINYCIYHWKDFEKRNWIKKKTIFVVECIVDCSYIDINEIKCRTRFLLLNYDDDDDIFICISNNKNFKKYFDSHSKMSRLWYSNEKKMVNTK